MCNAIYISEQNIFEASYSFDFVKEAYFGKSIIICLGMFIILLPPGKRWYDNSYKLNPFH